MARLSLQALQYLIDSTSNAIIGTEIWEAINNAASGGVGVGNPVSPSNANQILYVDGSLSLAQSAQLTFAGGQFNSYFKTASTRTYSLGNATNPFGFPVSGAMFTGEDTVNHLLGFAGVIDGTVAFSPSQGVVNVMGIVSSAGGNNSQNFLFQTLEDLAVQISDSTGNLSGSLQVSATSGAGFQINDHGNSVGFYLTNTGGTLHSGWSYGGTQFQLPTTSNSIGKVLGIVSTSGATILDWITVGGGSGAAGNTNNVQFNAGGGAFGGSNNFAWDGRNLLVNTVANQIGGHSGGMIVYGRSGGEAALALQPDNVFSDSFGQWILHTGTPTGFNSTHDFGIYNGGMGSNALTIAASTNSVGINSGGGNIPYTLSVFGDVGVFGGGQLHLFNGDLSQIRLAANGGSDGGIYYFPPTHPGSNTGYFLTSDTIGNMSWSTVSSGFTIGVFDTYNLSSDGLTFTGGQLYAQSASVTDPGMINATSTISSLQTMRGDKLFISYPVNISATGLSGEVSTNFNSSGTGQTFTGVLGQINQNDGQDHSSDNAYGFNSIINWNNSGNNIAGINNGVYPAGTGNLSQVFGISNVINDQSTLNISNEYGIYTHIYEGTSGSVNLLAGSWSEIYIANTGSFSSVYGDYVSIQAIGPGVGGSISNSYGYFIASMPSNIASNVYGFFDASLSISQFGAVNLMDAAVAQGGGLSMYNAGNSSGQFFKLQLSNAFSSSASYTVPDILPNGVNTVLSGTVQALVSNNSGTMGWANIPNLVTPNFVPGSIIFATAIHTLSQDNPHFYWDNTNKRIGVGTNAPFADITVERTGVASQVQIAVQNNSNANNSDAVLYLQTTYTGGGGGDPKVYMHDGIQGWAAGIDRQNDHRYSVSFGPSLAVNPAFTVDIGSGPVVASVHTNGGASVLELLTGNSTGRVRFITNGGSAQVDLTLPSSYPFQFAALCSDTSGLMSFVGLNNGKYVGGTTSNLVNLAASTFNPAPWQHIGNVTTMSAAFDVAITTDSLLTQFDFTLPTGSGFSAGTDGIGTCVLIDNSGNPVAYGYILGVSSTLTARATFIAPIGSGGNTWSLVTTITYTA